MCAHVACRTKLLTYDFIGIMHARLWAVHEREKGDELASSVLWGV